MDDDFEAFARDLDILNAAWGEGVSQADTKKARHKLLKSNVTSMAILMTLVTVGAICIIVNNGAPWYMVPIIQSATIVYFGLLIFVPSANKDNITRERIEQEAARRGIKVDKQQIAINGYCYLMNRINADYNRKLWNRKFIWE